MFLDRVLASVSDASYQPPSPAQHDQCDQEGGFTAVDGAGIAFTAPCTDKQKFNAADSTIQGEVSEDNEATREVTCKHHTSLDSGLSSRTILDAEADGALSVYERERLERIAWNKQVLMNLEIEHAVIQQRHTKPVVMRKKSVLGDSQACRKSPRPQQQLRDRCGFLTKSRTIAKPSKRKFEIKTKPKPGSNRPCKTKKKRKKATPAAILAGDDWDQRRSTGITIRGRSGQQQPVWAAYVLWHASLRAEVSEQKLRTQLPESKMQWIPGTRFSCFEEAYQGRKGFLEKHVGVESTKKILRSEEIRKENDSRTVSKIALAGRIARARHAKRNAASCDNHRTHKLSRIEHIPSSSSRGGTSRTRTTTSHATATTDKHLKAKASSGSRAALPWGVSCDVRRSGTFYAKILWPRSMSESVKGLGLNFRLGSRGEQWSHVGTFSSARDARDALEDFIQTLSSRELRTTMLARRAMAETRSGYDVRDCKDTRLGSLQTSILHTKRKASCDDSRMQKRRKVDPSQLFASGRGAGKWPRTVTNSDDDNDSEFVKGKASAESCEILPWGVTRWNSPTTCTFRASISWPKSMWETTKAWGYDFRPDPRGSEWKHVVGQFSSASEARKALEDFINELPSRELRTILFERRDLVERRKGYTADGDGIECKGGTMQTKERPSCRVDIHAEPQQSQLESPSASYVARRVKAGSLSTRSKSKSNNFRVKVEARKASTKSQTLPWGVYYRSDRAFHAVLSWPQRMWETVKGWGYPFRPNKTGSWKFHVGVSRSARKARDVLETFIHKLPSHELKAMLFARRAWLEKRKGYVAVSDSDDHDESAGPGSASQMHTKSRLSSGSGCDSTRLQKQSNLDSQQRFWLECGSRIRRDSNIRKKHAALPKSSEVLPWGVHCQWKQQTYYARVCWPTSYWSVVKSLGYEFRPDMRGQNWKHPVGQFSSAREARDALEAFIRKLPSSELKTALFARRALAEKRRGYGEGVCDNDSPIMLREKQMPPQRERSRGWSASEMRFTPGEQRLRGKHLGHRGRLPWGIVLRRKNGPPGCVRYQAIFRLPKDLLCARSSVRSAGKAIAVYQDQRVRLEQVKTMAQAIATQDRFIAGLEDKDLAQELLRRKADAIRARGADGVEGAPCTNRIGDRVLSPDCTECSFSALGEHDRHDRDQTGKKRQCWSQEEDDRLRQAVRRHGRGNLAAIVAEFQDRTYYGVKNRLKRLRLLPTVQQPSIESSGDDVVEVDPRTGDIADEVLQAGWETEGSGYLNRSVRFSTGFQQIDGLVVGWRPPHTSGCINPETGHRAAVWRLWINKYQEMPGQRPKKAPTAGGLSVPFFVVVQEREVLAGLLRHPEPTKRTRVEAGQPVWEVGREVQARHELWGWAPACILAVHDSGVIRVEWADGDETDRDKTSKDIRMPRHDSALAADALEGYEEGGAEEVEERPGAVQCGF